MKIDFKNYSRPIPKDFNIPDTGIEDVDRSIFKLFDKDISFEVLSNDELVKVPVVFAAGERFALTRRKNPIRDDNNTIILPIISIVRGGVDFSTAQNGRGSAIATRDQSGYVIKKRLADTDRDYQNLINKFGIKNQDNVSSRKNIMDNSNISPGQGAFPGKVATRRHTNSLRFSQTNGLINLNSELSLGNNIFELIQIPYPIFVTIEYTVTFWTQYMTQMNELQETFLSNMLGQSEEFLITSQKGYEFVAKSDTSFSSDTNFTNYTDTERIIKSNINMKVAGYILNSQNPPLPNQLRTFLSAPIVEFGYNDIKSDIVTNKPAERDVNNFILNDVKSSEDIAEDRDNQLRHQKIIVNPFTKNKAVSYSKIITSDQRSGETVASNLIIKKIETQYE